MRLSLVVNVKRENNNKKNERPFVAVCFTLGDQPARTTKDGVYGNR